MKFKVHLFREYRETYEVEADNADAALNLVDWTFAHYCAKRSIPFEVCYRAIFGCEPRI